MSSRKRKASPAKRGAKAKGSNTRASAAKKAAETRKRNAQARDQPAKRGAKAKSSNSRVSPAKKAAETRKRNAQARDREEKKRAAARKRAAKKAAKTRRRNADAKDAKKAARSQAARQGWLTRKEAARFEAEERKAIADEASDSRFQELQPPTQERAAKYPKIADAVERARLRWDMKKKERAYEQARSKYEGVERRRLIPKTRRERIEFDLEHLSDSIKTLDADLAAIAKKDAERAKDEDANDVGISLQALYSLYFSPDAA